MLLPEGFAGFSLFVDKKSWFKGIRSYSTDKIILETQYNTNITRDCSPTMWATILVCKHKNEKKHYDLIL